MHFYWYFASNVDSAADESTLCVQAWREVRGADDPIAALGLASTLVAVAWRPEVTAAKGALKELLPELLEDILILVLARPGAALLLCTVLALPLNAEGALWALPVLRRFGILSSGGDDVLSQTAAKRNGHKQLAALVQALCAIGMLPSFEDDLSPQDLWLYTTRALYSRKWAFPLDSLLKQLVLCKRTPRQQAPWGWPTGAFMPSNIPGYITLAAVPLEHDYNAPICISSSQKLYSRVDPWAAWMSRAYRPSVTDGRPDLHTP
jgi:hypothetical protein